MSQSHNSDKPVTQAVNEFLAFLLSEYPNIQKIIIALSGGRDSICLAHALSLQNTQHQIEAIYIDHGLQRESQVWAEFNQNFCNSLGLDYSVLKVAIDPNEASQEQAARNARYKAFAGILDSTSCLVTAQHKDDQAETLLLQLFRGSGVKGLASMPYQKSLNDSSLFRPLLQVSRLGIDAYIKAHQLDYIEDPSNTDESIRRNFLRLSAIPKLEEQWPELKHNLNKAAKNLSEAQSLLDEVAQQDLLKVGDNKRLTVPKLIELSEARQNNLLRYWLNQKAIRMPSKAVMQQIRQQFLSESNDSEPLIELHGYQLRSYQGYLYCIDSEFLQQQNNDVFCWQLLDDFDQVLGQKIEVDEVLKIWPELKGREVLVRYRQAGDKLIQPSKSHSQSLKNYFQEKKIPSWLRNLALLVEYRGKVIFIQEKTL